MKHGTVIRVMVPGQRWRYVREGRSDTPHAPAPYLVSDKKFATYYADWSEAQDVAEGLPLHMSFEPNERVVITDGKETRTPRRKVFTTDVEIITILRIERSER